MITKRSRFSAPLKRAQDRPSGVPGRQWTTTWSAARISPPSSDRISTGTLSSHSPRPGPLRWWQRCCVCGALKSTKESGGPGWLAYCVSAITLKKAQDSDCAPTWDALPIEEQTGKPYSSVRRGLMHACGHDGHTAALLGAARHLSGLKAQGACSQWNGTLHLIFQPAEECGLDGGGAVAMMRDGLFERFPCERIFAMHNAPSQPVGKVLTRAGPMMASSDRVDVTIRGEGGHAAFPHRSADPVLAVAALVMSLQSIVSRNVDPQDTAVISVGRMLAGEHGTYNVIPALARLELSVRALDAQVRVLLERRIGELARLQSESFNCSAQVNYMHGYPVLVNDASCSALVEKVARECFGSTMVDGQTSAITGSEDFASMLEVRPGCYFLMGNGNAPGSCMVHHPGYDFNDELLPASIRMWIGLCREVFNGARFP